MNKILVASCHVPLPPSSNNSYANMEQGGRSKTQKLRDWEEEAGWIWRTSGVILRFPEPRQTWGWSGKFVFPSLAKRDMDNCYKHVQDLIVRVVFSGAPDDRYMIWDEHTKHVVRPGDRKEGVWVEVYVVDQA